MIAMNQGLVEIMEEREVDMKVQRGDLVSGACACAFLLTF